MGERREESLSEIAWPGFVDILSSVIIMFIFFLLIVATALFFHTIIYKSQILATESTKTQKVDSEIDSKISQMQTQFAESKDQSVKVDSATEDMIIFFGKDSISVLPETIGEIKVHIAKFMKGKEADAYNIKIVASKSPQTYENAARKIALARLLNVRNVVMDAGFSPEAVDPKIVEGGAIDDSFHWVKVVFEKK